MLARTAGDRPHIRRLRIQHHAALGRMVARDIEQTLSEATVGWEDDITCKEAIDAAVALALDDVVAGGLDHMFTSVIVSSLKAVGEPLAAPLPDSVLALAAARGKPVREALLDLLTAKPHRNHLPTVMILVRDEWCAS